MTDVGALFFDVGGVLLSNGWDRHSRRRATEEFGLDWEEYSDRHELVVDEFETGRLSLDDYLTRTVFYRDRAFTRDQFVDFMKDQSSADPAALEVLGALSASGRYLLATLNNESRELNEHRISRFGLDEHFSMFLSSCYLGVRKPDAEIYRLAVDITQRTPSECVFIDDRALNLECAGLVGIRPIHFTGAAGLTAALAHHGVRI